MKIGVDILGGDFAPEAIIKGSILASRVLDDSNKLVLFGDEKSIVDVCKKEKYDVGKFEIVHTTEHISMGDHPAKAFSHKQNSSIVLGFGMLAHGKIDAFASAGNTGAMLVGAMQVVKSIPGVIRPCITVSVPRLSGPPAILLDVGLNPDCKPDVLYQYGILGSLYAKNVSGVENPKVGLINIGSEEEKGNLLTKTTYQAMKGSTDFNFIGNIEGNDIFSDMADVMVCDGFVGNIMLKEIEAFYKLIRMRKITDEFFEKFNFENYGGTSVLGINAPVIIGHGISNDIAIKNMILHTKDVVNAGLSKKIKEVFK